MTTPIYPKLTEEQKTLIIERIREGESLTKICKWNRINYHSCLEAFEKDEDFLQRYTRARETQADFYAEKLLEIAETEPPIILDQFGNARIDPAWSAIQKNKLDTLKFIAAKLKPKVYGDSTTLKGDSANPLANFGAMLDAVSRRIEQRNAKMLEIEQKPAIIDVTPDPTKEESPI